MKKNNNNNNKNKKINKITILFIILDILAASCFFIVYGPWDYARNLVVTTAMQTRSHKYIAKIFYDDKKIEQIMNSNYFEAINDAVYFNDIVFYTDDKI